MLHRNRASSIWKLHKFIVVTKLWSLEAVQTPCYRVCPVIPSPVNGNSLQNKWSTLSYFIGVCENERQPNPREVDSTIAYLDEDHFSGDHFIVNTVDCKAYGPCTYCYTSLGYWNFQHKMKYTSCSNKIWYHTKNKNGNLGTLWAIIKPLKRFQSI